MASGSRWRWGRSRSSRTTGPAEGPLSAWSVGEAAVVLEVPGASAMASRLRELGVVPGALVRVLRTGWSLVIQVAGGRFCLRREDAACIRLRRGPQSAPADAAG